MIWIARLLKVNSYLFVPMRLDWFVFLATLIVVCSISLATGIRGQRPANKISVPLSSRELVKRVMPSVVLIEAKDRQGRTVGQGSGFVFAPGLIATNLHIFKRASGAEVRVVNNKTIHVVDAVVGVDVRRDLCIIRIAETSLPTIRIAEVRAPDVGDEVYVFGNPVGLEGSVSKGIVSGLRTGTNLIQIDASISPGSSGGPVVNARAEAIGVTVASITRGQNLNFAVPVRFVNEIPRRQFDKDLLTTLKRIRGASLQDSDFGLPVEAAGGLAVSDSENEQLKGAVKGYTNYRAEFYFDVQQSKYVEESRKIFIKRSFDEFGFLIEEDQYYLGILAWRRAFSRDSLGFASKILWESGDGEREEKTYDSTQAAWQRFEGANPVGLAGTSEDSRWKLIRDSSGNLSESTDKLTNYRWEKSYGSGGLLIEDKHFSNGTLVKVYKYSYQFDQKGNWIKTILAVLDPKHSALGFIPIYVEYRELIYF